MKAHVRSAQNDTNSPGSHVKAGKGLKNKPFFSSHNIFLPITAATNQLLGVKKSFATSTGVVESPGGASILTDLRVGSWCRVVGLLLLLALLQLLFLHEGQLLLVLLVLLRREHCGQEG